MSSKPLHDRDMYPPYPAERKWECYMANSLNKGGLRDVRDQD